MLGEIIKIVFMFLVVYFAYRLYTDNKKHIEKLDFDIRKFGKKLNKKVSK